MMTRHPSRALSSCGRVAPHVERDRATRRPPPSLDRRTGYVEAAPDEILDVVSGPFARPSLPGSSIPTGRRRR
jgi:hypothetical protein